MANKYFKFLIIVLAVAVIVPQIALAAWWNPFSWNWGRLNSIFHFQKTEQKQEQTACTMEAKLCPDGSSVGRQGPKCEFKACPREQCKKENEQCGFSFGKKIGDCCEGSKCELESSVPDAAAKCKKAAIVGGDKDAHGCIGSAGYSWCEVKKKCLRSWEESCSVTSAGTQGFECRVACTGARLPEGSLDYCISQTTKIGCEDKNQFCQWVLKSTPACPSNIP